MTEEVLKGYSPEELDRWETKEGVQWAKIGLTAFGSAIVFMCLGAMLQSDSHIWDDIVFLCGVGMLGMSMFVMLCSESRYAFRYRVCRALAGLELGVFHCSDDLVILLRIDRPYADKIINGEYHPLHPEPGLFVTPGLGLDIQAVPHKNG